MLNEMPVGEPKKIKNIDKLNINKFFGFLTVKIEVKKTNIPFLGFRNKLLNLYPYGIFVTSIFSEELKYELNVNSIKILKIILAVKFKKKIYKNFLNNLYGRMGLKKEISITKIINKNDFWIYEFLFNASIITETKNNYLINIKTFNINIENYENNKEFLGIAKTITKEISLKKKNLITAPQIASAITAYARINIDNYKRHIINKDYKIFYSDTDSLITDMPDNLISTSDELGKLKLEYKINEAIFLSPKCYILILEKNIVFKYKGINNETIKKINNYKDKNIIKFYKNLYKNITKNKNIFIQLPIRKNFKSLNILNTSIIYTPNFNSNKRLKLFNSNKKWINTEPIKI